MGRKCNEDARGIEYMSHVEVVVPCYNEQECVRPLYEEMNRVFIGIQDTEFSILFINDGSSDGTLSEIKELVEEFGSEKIRYLSLSRNFGKEAAIYAGFENCKGDIIVLMDADLQHPPALIPEMLQGLAEGYDVCGARRVSRKGEPMFRSFFSKAFYGVINRLTAMKLVPGGSDFRAMKKCVADAVVSFPERERFIKGIFSWAGFETKWIEYENVPRHAGKSKWSFFGLVRYAWKGYFSFATAPLRVAVFIGVATVVGAFIYAIRVLIQVHILHSRLWEDTTTIILLLLFLGGVLASLLGVVGEYLAKIYAEIKQRPIYVEKESNLS